MYAHMTVGFMLKKQHFDGASCLTVAKQVEMAWVDIGLLGQLKLGDELDDDSESDESDDNKDEGSDRVMEGTGDNGDE